MKNIGFIGAGQMAQALGAGIASFNPEINQFISDPNPTACDAFKKSIGENASVSTVVDNQTLVDQCDMVILAVKPQFLDDAIEAVQFTNQPLVVSIVAGVQIYRLERLANTKRVIRVMPNTPCLVGQGASALSASDEVSPDDIRRVLDILESIGVVVVVDESQLDAVTGLSGSGPAYVFTFIESLIDGAVLTGMPRETARILAIQTVLGAVSMLKKTGEHPAILRDRVTSPGGTTIEALKSLEENSFRDTVMSAVFAATERSKELA